MKIYSIVAVVSLASLLGGCAAIESILLGGGTLSADQRAQVDAAKNLLEADRQVRVRIAESTTSIANTLQLIERIERGSPSARGPATNKGMLAAGSGVLPPAAVTWRRPSTQSGYVSDVLDSRLRIQWRNGSAEELLRTLAKQMSVPFKVSGEKRSLPVVTVVSENDSMALILAAVGSQIDGNADVVFNKNEGQAILELRFK